MYDHKVKIITLLLFLYTAASAEARVKKYVEMHCFQEEVNAKETIAYINLSYASRIPRTRSQYNMDAFNRRRDQVQKEWPKLELITDTPDKYGRAFCIMVEEKKLNNKDITTVGSFQIREAAQIKEKNRILAQSMKDPWGGQHLDRSGKPKVLRSCLKIENAKSDELECDDLIITARNGDDNVVEYRFWLGFQSGEGFVVYKSPANNVELGKVMAQLKKDKKEIKYSFGPQGSKDSELIEDAKISGE